MLNSCHKLNGISIPDAEKIPLILKPHFLLLRLSLDETVCNLILLLSIMKTGRKVNDGV